MKFTLYTANCTGNAKNSIYPNKADIANEEDFKVATCRDHVSAEYKNFHRSNSNYITGNVDVMDCDNDHSDHPKDWIYPDMYPGFPRYVTSHLTAFPQLSIFRSSQQRYNP